VLLPEIAVQSMSGSSFLVAVNATCSGDSGCPAPQTTPHNDGACPILVASPALAKPGLDGPVARKGAEVPASRAEGLYPWGVYPGIVAAGI